MKLPNKTNPLLAVAIVLAVSGTAHARNHPVVAEATNSPSADYPILIGQPFTVDGVVYTPADKMNYDATGYAVSSAEGGNSVTAAHRTLPLPCYVEVTALTTGKTILVRLERRGPMSGNGLIELSPGASAQLGVNGDSQTPVRVRRVNPPEPERALLRAGQSAPYRMDTPPGLLTVLMRKLDGSFKAPITPVVMRPDNIKPVTPKPPLRKIAKAVQPSVEPQESEPVPAMPMEAASDEAATPDRSAPTSDSVIVQVAAYSSKQRARSAAARSGGSVVAAGNIWRVRMGPFPNREAAQAALAKARAAGYSDARILSAR